jgi:hypothetical protein
MLELLLFSIYQKDLTELRHDNHHLLQEVDIALGLIKRLAERLREALGPEALEPELNRFLEACDPIAAGSQVSKLDELIQQSEEGRAVRELRAIFGLTWDEAHEFHNHWSNWDRGRKIRFLQASELRKLFDVYRVAAPK